MERLEKLLSRLSGRASARTRQFKNSEHVHLANPWHAVAIVTSRPNCPVCGKYKGIRFLAKEAPGLPLRGCPDPKACNSIYKHFPDRRGGPRRAAERRAYQPMNANPVMRAPGDDRRGSAGRRSTDGQ
jgi:hypothetical protein